MPRLVSFIMLVAIILFMGALLFKVLAQFLLPIFLAVLLVVMFTPLHEWMLEKCGGRIQLASALTTLAILLIVLLPLTWIVARAANEGVAMASRLDEQEQAVLRKKMGNLTNDLRGFLARAGVVLPSDAELVETATEKIQQVLAPAAIGGVQFAISVVIGLCIMILSLYYFLVDGPAMIDTVMRLSPLDDRYERQLLEQFGNVSRAVVIATLLSAFVQGLLAGAAFWMVGLQLTTLLMALTMLLAMVPFVGAAAVWIPCSLWLYFHDGRPTAAIALAVYGALVISMADNVIKPLVLAGRSKLHPLLALLSILGGVQALGPIGILVGPMLFSFLQALLVMLRQELDELGKQKAPT